VERKHLLLIAVHREHELKAANAIIINGFDLYEYFLNRVRPHVAPGLTNRDAGRLVVQRLDQVVRGGDHELTVRPRQLHAVEGLAPDFQRTRESPLHRGERDWFFGILDDDPPSCRRESGSDQESYLGTSKHGDVAAVFDDARSKTGVAREVVLQVDLVHVGQISDLDREEGRAHALRLHRVLGRLAQIEEEDLEAIHILAPGHPKTFPGLGLTATNRDLDLIRLEALRDRADRLIRAARYEDVARLYSDGVRVRGVRRLPRAQQQRAGGPLERGPEEHDQEGGGCHAPEPCRRTL
jgi:hypothetical protein